MLPVCGSRWGHLPHAGVLQDTHDPLNPVHGHALLETAESWKRRKLYREPRELCWQQGCESVEQMDCVKCVCGGADSLPLWPGSAGSHKVWQRSQMKQFSEPVWTWRCLLKTLTMPIRRLTNSSCFEAQHVLAPLCQAANLEAWYCSQLAKK